MKTFFITGTDTEVGKTFFARALLAYFKAQGMSTAGFKPCASGCERNTSNLESRLENEDAAALHALSTLDLTYEEVNPYAFEAAIAPHIAAAQVGQELVIDDIATAYRNLVSKQPDVLVVEGAGGWRLPLGNNAYLSDFVAQLQIPVIMVVGMRLGCLNHAKLTEDAIQQDGLRLAGWVANHVDPDMPYLQENVESLKSLISAPFLGEMPKVAQPEALLAKLDFAILSN